MVLPASHKPLIQTAAVRLTGEIFELKAELNNEKKEKRKEAVKKVIAAMTVGKDVRYFNSFELVLGLLSLLPDRHITSNNLNHH